MRLMPSGKWEVCALSIKKTVCRSDASGRLQPEGRMEKKAEKLRLHYINQSEVKKSNKRLRIHGF